MKEMIPFCEANKGRYGYSKAPMIPPPSERGSNVIQFELTTGCSHNRCTFCDMYKTQTNTEKSIDEFKHHVEMVIDRATRSMFPEKIFIGSGNALSVSTEKLIAATQYSLYAVKKETRETPKRLSMYGNTNDILKHGKEGIKELRCGGVCSYCSVDILGERRGLEVVYWGIESGNNDILKAIGKGYKSGDIIKAGHILLNAQVRASVMVMPGLGGYSNYERHVRDTVQVLNEIEPTWITFMGLSIKHDTPYEKWMKDQEKQNKNRRLTPKEITEQTAEMIEGLRIYTNIGVHGPDIHQKMCVNPVVIGSETIYDRQDAKDLARIIRGKIPATLRN